MQLGLGPAPQRVLGQLGLAFAPRGHDDAIDGARFADRVAGIDRTPRGVRHIRCAAKQPRQTVVRLCDRVAHSRAPWYIDRFVVDENPHQRSVRWKRTSSGASTGERITPR